MIKTIEKSWGQQVWLDDHRQIMLMKAGGRTSFHFHQKHLTRLSVLSGTMEVHDSNKQQLAVGEVYHIANDIGHRITAITDCVLYEEYFGWDVDADSPEDDIVRISP